MTGSFDDNVLEIEYKFAQDIGFVVLCDEVPQEQIIAYFEDIGDCRRIEVWVRTSLKYVLTRTTDGWTRCGT